MKNKSQARPNNKNGIKIKDKDSRQEAYRAYLKHLEEGYPEKAFSFHNDKGAICSWETIKKYIKENPGEFDPILIQVAMAKRFKYWFEIGKGLTIGKIKHGSPVSWQTIMRNMFKDYGWDKNETKQSSFTPEQEETIKALFRGIQEMRENDRSNKKS